MEGLFEKGIAHFNEKKYFEAHEDWEKIWLDAKEEKLFLQGLIQIAAGYHHYFHDNENSAVFLIKRGSDYISKYPNDYMGIDSGKLIKEARASVKKIEKKCLRSLPQITKP